MTRSQDPRPPRDGHPDDLQLNGYLDGDLPAAEAARLATHLAECDPCRRRLDSLGELAEATAALPREIPPGRDLWPEIEARLQGNSAPARRPGDDPGAAAGRPWLAWAAAAAVVLALAGSWLWGRSGLPEGTPEVDPVVQAQLEAQMEALARQARAEDGALVTREALEEQLATRRWPPEAVQAVRDSLGDLDRAIGETRAALRDHPDDPRLRGQLAGHYQQEARLLYRIQAL